MSWLSHAQKALSFSEHLGGRVEDSAQALDPKSSGV